MMKVHRFKIHKQQQMVMQEVLEVMEHRQKIIPYTRERGIAHPLLPFASSEPFKRLALVV